jgi:exopolysaccharide biosynthesis polyprenyl glycosylphosphotransferase
MKSWIRPRLNRPGAGFTAEVGPSGAIVPPRPPDPVALRPPPTPLSGWATRLAVRVFDRRDWRRLRLMVDVVVLYVAAATAVFGYRSPGASTVDHVMAAIFPLIVVITIRARRAPDDHLNASILDTLINVVGTVSLSVMLALATDTVLGSTRPLGLAIRLWLYALVYLGVARAVLVAARRQAMRSEAFSVPTLIIGAGMIGNHLAMRLFREPGYGLRPVAFLDADPLLLANQDRSMLPVLGGPVDLPEALRTTGARHVILAFSGERDHALVKVVRQCERYGIGVSLVPRLYESINERASLDHVGGLPLLTLNSINPYGWQFAVKHLIDRGLALLGLIAVSPVLIFVAVAVRISSDGPILFRQRRVGRDNHEFDLLKFRTMRLVAERDDHPFELKPGLAPGGIEGVDRRTWIGRWLRALSIDELPQLLNVLRGDMSLVGPRPERPEYAALFAREVARYDDRHRVKSGMTGWAQVHGLRGQTSIADRIEWDNYYIANWSLKLDVKILLLTVAELLRFRDSQAARAQTQTQTQTDATMKVPAEH